MLNGMSLFYKSRNTKSLKLATVFILLILVYTLYPLSAEAQDNLALQIYVAPNELPADGGSYSSIIIQLQKDGQPVLAPHSFGIVLISSNMDIGTVESEVTLLAGRSSVTAEFQTTRIAGETKITASADGAESGSVKVTTAKVAGTASKLGLYLVPSVIYARSGITGQMIIRLETSDGFPIPALSDIKVSLFPLKTEVGYFEQEVTIPEGESQVTTTFYATYRSGNVTITARAEGYAPAEALMKTVGYEPSKIALYIVPEHVHLKDDIAWIIVQLLDSKGNPVKAPEDISVALSSDKPDIAYPEGQTAILKGETETRVKLILTPYEGKATITAAAADFPSVKASVTSYERTGEPASFQLSVPYNVPADGSAHDIMLIQFKDSTGKPAIKYSPTTMHLSSNNLTVGSTTYANMLGEHSYAIGHFKATYTPGSATISAYTSGWETKTSTITTKGEAPSKVSLSTGSSKIYADNSVQLVAVQLRDSSGNPVRAGDEISVSLYSSNEVVGTIDPSVLIRKGRDHAIAQFYTTDKAGSTIITSETHTYDLEPITITTTAFPKLTLAPVPQPEKIVANDLDKGFIFVQLQDAEGKPFTPRSDITVYLTSSDSSVATVDSTIIIPARVNFAIAEFRSAGAVEGNSSISIMSSGFESSTLKVYTIIPEEETPEPEEDTKYTPIPGTIITNPITEEGGVVQILYSFWMLIAVGAAGLGGGFVLGFATLRRKVRA